MQFSFFLWLRVGGRSNFLASTINLNQPAPTFLLGPLYILSKASSFEDVRAVRALDMRQV